MIEKEEIRSMLREALINFDNINIPERNYGRNVKFCVQRADVAPLVLKTLPQEYLETTIKTLTVVFDKETISITKEQLQK